MLEEQVGTAMDKKSGTRTSSIPPKLSGPDAKKSDNGASNKFTRYPKKKEGNGNKPFQDNGRRPNPQRTRATADKRPRFKGFYPDRPRNDVAEDLCTELRSAVNFGSRKANLNHLLNFTYAPRDTYRGGSTGGQRQRNRGRVFYNKERFLQANCQFVVRETGDYAIHNIDPDILVDWVSVEQVRVNSHELPSCPICLQHPLAAKMTRCGHIYCWACILHYLALGEKTWRKCPICYESVHSKDIKSVLTRKLQHYKVGETINMKLMKKEKGCTFALPITIWRKSSGEISNVEDSPEVTIHKKLLLATPAQINRLVIEPEKAELQKQLSEAESSEVAFIESALDAINERQQTILGVTKVKEEVDRMLDRISADPLSGNQSETKTVKSVASDKKIKRYASAFSDEEEEEKSEIPKSPLHVVASCPEFGIVGSCSDSPDETMTDGACTEGAEGHSDSPSPETVKHPGPELDRPDCLPVEEAAESLELPESDTERRVRKSSGNAYYFFQASDGQPIFINALNAHCLVKEYGSLENCPETITANIVEMEHVFMSEELRRRLRYLSHLPLSSEFEVVELILRPPVISKETIRQFTDQIEHHRRIRQKKNREEKRWTRKVEEEESRKLGIVSDIVIVKSQFKQPPSEISPAASSINTPVSSPSADDVPISQGSEDGQPSTSISFAQMLKGGKAKAPVWPKTGKTDSNELASDMSPTSHGADSEGNDCEDGVPVPQYRSSFGDAIEAAFVTLAKSKDYSDIRSPDKSSGKKKKKQKQTLLFATSMARGGK